MVAPAAEIEIVHQRCQPWIGAVAKDGLRGFPRPHGSNRSLWRDGPLAAPCGRVWPAGPGPGPPEARSSTSSSHRTSAFGQTRACYASCGTRRSGLLPSAGAICPIRRPPPDRCSPRATEPGFRLPRAGDSFGRPRSGATRWQDGLRKVMTFPLSLSLFLKFPLAMRQNMSLVGEDSSERPSCTRPRR